MNDFRLIYNVPRKPDVVYFTDRCPYFSLLLDNGLTEIMDYYLKALLLAKMYSIRPNRTGMRFDVKLRFFQHTYRCSIRPYEICFPKQLTTPFRTPERILQEVLEYLIPRSHLISDCYNILRKVKIDNVQANIPDRSGMSEWIISWMLEQKDFHYDQPLFNDLISNIIEQIGLQISDLQNQYDQNIYNVTIKSMEKIITHALKHGACPDKLHSCLDKCIIKSVMDE
jgi:hypothetical protein